MFKGLQAKMVLILVLLSVLSMSVVGVVLVNSVGSFYAQDFLSQMDSFFSGTVLTQINDSANADESGEELFNVLSVYSSQLGLDTYRNMYILSEEGNLISGTNQQLGQALVKTENMLSVMSGGGNTQTPRSEGYMDYAKKITSDGGKTFIIYIRDTKEEVRDLLWVMIILIIKTVVIAIFIAFLLSFILAGAISRPIKNITKSVKKIQEGDFSYHIDSASKDEIGMLSESFNDMAQVLETTLSKIEDEREKLSTIFLYMTDGVVAFDDRGMLLHINETASGILGRPYIVGAATFEAVFFEYTDVNFEEMQEKLTNGTFTSEIAINEKVYKCDFADFSHGNKGRGIIAVIHDITEQAEIDRSRREFIANVSHELRTPLTNVKSYTETVVENSDMEEADKAQFLGVVLSETDRMISIVKDLLVLSRLDNKKMDVVMTPFSAEEAVIDVYNAMKIEADKHNQNIRYEVKEDMAPVLGDKGRIEQVLVNIVSNSVKYTPDGGEINIIASEHDDNIVFTVKDNGMGIPEENLKHIFERFYRVDKARSREQGGTGLGLSIAKEIVEAHGGTIKMESSVGRGTTVTVTLRKHK